MSADSPSAVGDPETPLGTRQRYDVERGKRLREDGRARYIDLQQQEEQKYRRFIDDPFIVPSQPLNSPEPDGGSTKILIVGAGIGGILSAVKFITAGFKARDLLIVDPAGGFGGTWYWNRYPGLMCDVESYIYLPLLEETGYVPKRKYSSGAEIRQYLDSIASKYELHQRAMFQSSCTSMDWDSKANSWTVRISRRSQDRQGQESSCLIHATFAVLSPGVLSNAKLPDLKGFHAFQGHTFHTARWDYAFTGGSPEDPTLSGLNDKTVALIGTGATAVQVLPDLARHARKLYVVQRTPSAVDVRNNHDTDPSEWAEITAAGPGWQRARSMNFVSRLNNINEPGAQTDLINDGWTNMRSYSALLGTPRQVGLADVPAYIEELHGLDGPRQERIRKRVSEVVRDEATATSLQAWYPGWCKRPTFHDEYLAAFNSPNVELVDTDGRGVDSLSSTGVVAGGREFDVDVVIWGTGFRFPALGSPAGKMGIKLTGREGRDMEDANAAGDLITLHGVMSNGFPNLFWLGPSGTAASANYSTGLEVLAEHVAYIVSETVRRAGLDGENPKVEVTKEAQEKWATTIAAGSFKLAAMVGCTPGYLNGEGAVDEMTSEERVKAARGGVYADGFANFVDVLESWRAKGDLEGVEITAPKKARDLTRASSLKGWSGKLNRRFRDMQRYWSKKPDER